MSGSDEIRDPRDADRRTCILALGFLVGTAFLWATLFTTARFVQRDAYDYAHLGRQIRVDHSFTTRQLFPRDLPYYQEKGFLGSGMWPSLHRYPVVPLLSALFQLFTASEIRAAVVQTGVWFLLSVPLFFLLAVRLTDIKLASLATVAYIGDPQVWGSSYDGMSESFSILVLLLIFHIGLQPAIRDGRGNRWTLLGLLCGLAYLARPQLVFLLPLGMVLALTVKRRRRIRSAALFCAGVALLVTPWLLRNLAVTGDPFFSFTNSRALLAKSSSFPHGSLDLELHGPIDLPVVLDIYGDVIAAKIRTHFWPNLISPAFWWEMLSVYALFLPLFVLGLLVRRATPPKHFLFFEKIVLILVLANFLLLCTTYHKPRYYETLLPFLIIAVARRLWWLAELVSVQAAVLAAGRWLRAVVVFLLAAAILRSASTFAQHMAIPERDPSELRSYEILTEVADRESVILSDLSLEVALLSGHRTIRPPLNPEEVFEIDRNYIPIDYLLFSGWFMQSRYRAFVESETFGQEYRFLTALPNQARLFEKRERRPRTPNIQRTQSIQTTKARVRDPGLESRVDQGYRWPSRPNFLPTYQGGSREP